MLLARLRHVVGPQRALHFADVRLAQEEHTDARLADAVAISRMIHNVDSVIGYYGISGTNKDGMDEVIEFLSELRETAWENMRAS